MVLFVLELAAFAVALTAVDTTVAYALYGLGTATVATISINALGEPADPPKIVALATVVLGAVLLNTA
jgi:multidrug transporter EmrE-like cation transporter